MYVYGYKNIQREKYLVYRDFYKDRNKMGGINKDGTRTGTKECEIFKIAGFDI